MPAIEGEHIPESAERCRLHDGGARLPRLGVGIVVIGGYMRRGARVSFQGITSVGLLVVAAYGLMSLVLFIYQPRLFYFPDFPSRAIEDTPADIGLDYEDVAIMTQDEVQLAGWFVPARSARGVVLFFHGNAGNISHRLDSLRLFNQLGFATLIIDYRGYGRSEGRPSEEGTYRDAEAAWRTLTEDRGYAPGDIVLFGRSLGGAVAAYLATRYKPRALIVESTFTSVPDLAAELYPLLPARWITRYRYDTAMRLGTVSCPVLVVHSRDDDIISFVHGQRLYEAARPPKQALWIHGGHNDGFLRSGSEYTEGLDRFLSRAPPQAPAP